MAIPDPNNLREPSRYTHWHEDVLRFGDMDLVWHVDHAVYVTLFQGARIEFWRWADYRIIGPQVGLVMVHFQVDIHKAIEYPGRTRIGTRILKMGSSSVRYGQLMVNEKGEACATCEAVNVQVENATNKPVPWDAAAKARLLAL